MQCKDRYCPDSLGEYLNLFMRIPTWLDTEIKENYGGWDNDHAFATADMGVLIYQAMLKGSEEV